MNIKMNSLSSWPSNSSKSSGMHALSGKDVNKQQVNGAAIYTQRMNQNKQSATQGKNEELRNLLRGLDGNNKNNNSNKATLIGKTNGFLDTKTKYNTKDKLDIKKYKYNYKQISSKILSAKTSVSAGQAVIAAKRKVIEVKRKLVANPKDSDELQAALIHAERMEMAARKKKHNLEMEELVSNTMKRDDFSKKRDELNQSSEDMTAVEVDAREEEIYGREDEIFTERQEMVEDLRAQIKEGSLSDLSEEMFERMQQTIAEFGEDELEALEEMMQIAETMEIVNPHMSEEDYNKMKAKHRADEQKAIMKADMDYLKAILKLNFESEAKASQAALSSAQSSMNATGFSLSGSTPTIDISTVEDVAISTATGGPAIDMAL